ncbi:hypothetical protein LCGC14_3072870 [marine sediment metagenome]|uniref:Uncharacterized protein n=1 Tax=marine sediment metagenome TaxID=412755 RepID=A0A0F8YN68_9ZZZZ
MAENGLLPGRHIPTPGPYEPWNETRGAYWDRIMDYVKLVEEDAKARGWEVQSSGLWRRIPVNRGPSAKVE